MPHGSATTMPPLNNRTSAARTSITASAMSCMDDRSVRFACGVAMSHRCQRTNSREPSGIPTHQREQHAAELRECNAFSTIYEGGASSHPELSLKTRVEARVGENEIHAPGLHSRVDFDERQWYRGEIVSCCGTAVKFFSLKARGPGGDGHVTYQATAATGSRRTLAAIAATPSRYHASLISHHTTMSTPVRTDMPTDFIATRRTTYQARPPGRWFDWKWQWPGQQGRTQPGQQPTQQPRRVPLIRT